MREYSRLEDSEVALGQFQLGVIYYAMGEWNMSLQSYSKALKVFFPNIYI